MPTPRPPVGGSEGVRARGSDFEEPGSGSGWSLLQGVPPWPTFKSSSATRTWPVPSSSNSSTGAKGKLAKAVLIAISNQHRGSGEDREERAVSIRWTLWGKQAEHAAEYLGKGSHVNLVGRLHNNHYQDAEGGEVYGMEFTVEDIDYLDSKAESEARTRR